MLGYQDKTKDGLIKELKEVKLRYDSLKATIENSLTEKENEKLILEKLIGASKGFIPAADFKTDYIQILQTALEISGAKYASFNFFDNNGLDFTTVAFVGIHEKIMKASSFLGFDVINSYWNHDPQRAEKTR
jgi:hypothetical protein